MTPNCENLRRGLRLARRSLETTLIEPLLITIVRIATLPYYRLFQFNTSAPLAKIASLAIQSQESSHLLRAVALWRTRKLRELQFISISCAILAAAVIGAFSWTAAGEAFWLTHGFWHGSLVLAILGILLSASEVTVLNILGPLPSRKKSMQDRLDAISRYEPLLLSNVSGERRPRKKMVFIWQCPMMFMAYSVCSFLAGLTILVCTPLIRFKGKWNSGCNIAIMYLTICAMAGTAYIFCTYWVYHYVDLNFDRQESSEDDFERGDFELFSYRNEYNEGILAPTSSLDRVESSVSYRLDYN